MSATLLIRVIEAANRAIGERAHELDLLDAAIGDGDHGTNLARGLAAVAASKEELAAQPLAEALRRMAGLLAHEAGGDGGRFYGALLAGMASAAPAEGADLAALSRMLEAGVAAIGEEGGARAGEKTMLDVLQPVARALASAVAQNRTDRLGGLLVAAAGHGLHRTSRVAAKHGLAAGLGEASLHHLDPGAWSSALIVGAAVGALEQPAGT